jgi:hypothetical protein
MNVVNDGSSGLTSLSAVALKKILALIFVNQNIHILELNRYHKTSCFILTCVNTFNLEYSISLLIIILNIKERKFQSIATIYIYTSSRLYLVCG